jgi:hypothetical protein
LRIKKLALASALAMGSLTAQAATVLSEGFDNWAAVLGSGWQTVNLSPSPGSNWVPGNPLIFPAASGAASSYASASFLSTTATTGPISNWLITPLLSLDATSTVSFDVRVVGQGFVDTVQVLVSTTGPAPDNFTLVGTYASSTADQWVPQSFGLGLSGATSGYVAFHYVAADVATASDYLGIDNVSITGPIPEPATYLIMGLGLAGVLLRRRFTV